MDQRITEILKDFADVASVRISAVATNNYMRDTGVTSLPNNTSTLRIQTGRLARSITGQSGEGINEVTVENGIMRYEKGTNVPYAGVHENGFFGNVNVRAHTRVMNQAFGRQTLQYTQEVRQHNRNMQIPARPYLRPAIEDNRQWMGDYLAEAFLELLQDLPNESN